MMENFDPNNIPKHIAIIMDGNGRWAKEKGNNRVFGHKEGVKSVKRVVEKAAELKVEYLTLYAFSTENWNRPKFEVDALMSLLVNTINSEISLLNENNVQLKAIGNLNNLPKDVQDELQQAIDKTSVNSGLTLVLALSYSSREEIIQAVKSIAIKVDSKELEIENINDELFSNHLYTAEIPDPELVIRTSGEQRISNFLLWQISYSEFYFTDTFWPDFSKDDLLKAIMSYQNRERRFGKTGEQLKQN